jgi:hypothetical protein
MAKCKIDSLHSTIASDSDSESDHDNIPRNRQEGLYHRGIRTDAEGCTQVSTTMLTVLASPTKKKVLPQRNLLEDDDALPTAGWDNGSPSEQPFPFALEDSFAFDEGHPVDVLPRAARESVRFCSEFFISF